MDISFSQEENTFRDQVRTWLEENKPKEARPDDPLEAKEYDKAWQRTKFDGGWAGVNWPKEYGGLELGMWEQMIWHEESTRAGTSEGYMMVALNHGGLTVAYQGNDEQRAEHLPKIMRGEKVWWQGFSEPNAGSDLAGIRTRGVVDGDDLVINGQKIWSSHAFLGDWQILLIRTDPDAERHKGLSLVLNWQGNEGMDIRKIPQMNGGSDLCEVFYEDVRVPLANVVGEVNDGWKVAMGTLGVEHGTRNIAGILGLEITVESLIDLAKETLGPDGKRYAIEDDGIAHRLAVARATARGLRSTVYLDLSRAAHGQMGLSFYQAPSSLLGQELSRLAMDILGSASLVRTGSGEEMEGANSRSADWVSRFLGSFAGTIGGGTIEIQRNNIGRRLGLPK